MTTKKTIKSAFESMMFIWGEPLDAKLAASAMNIERGEALECFRELMNEYDEQERGIRIREVNGKFQFITPEGNYDYIRSIVTPAKERRLTQAALETLAIIAYKQPVTKGEIDSIRGIKSERVIEGLARKGLVCERGRSPAVGRPILYGTTDVFLTNFDLNTIKELPQIEDIEDAILSADPTEAVDPRQTSIDFDGLDGKASGAAESEARESEATESVTPESDTTGHDHAESETLESEDIDSSGAVSGAEESKIPDGEVTASIGAPAEGGES